MVPACHDTGSAFAAVAAGGATAFLSSGTWSLLGTELSAPIITPRALELDFTNEGGVCGTTRLLKNIGGLWLLQSCRRSWAASGPRLRLRRAGGRGRRASGRSTCCSIPTAPASGTPTTWSLAIDGFCRQTGQPALGGPPSYSRAIMESLAFKYRAVLESLEELTGRRFDEIRVVGGGARNRLLNQFTADATGRTVIAGPVEATALGNVAMQMLATGAVTSLAEARAIIDRSFPVERFEPAETDRWEPHYQRFREYDGVDLCLTSSVVDTKFLQNLWDDAEASRLSPLEQLRYRSNRLGDDLRITNFGGGNTSSKFDLPDPLTGEPTRVLAVKGSGGDLRSITASGFAILYMDKLEALIRRYRGEAHEDEMVAYYPLAAFGENRVAASIDTPLHAFLPFDHVDHLHPDWAIALAASANGKEKLAEFNQRSAARIVWLPWQRPGLRAGADAAPRRRGESRLRRDHSRWPRPVHVGPDAAGVLPEQHSHHRPDGRVHRRTSAAGEPAAVRWPRGW